MRPSQRTVRAGELDFAVLEAGEGPLALCLHGFPDTAWTWRHLLPELAAAGFHAVAPFMRGYAPTAVPVDGSYQTGVLVRDAAALHTALGGGQPGVLIGHDWGAMAAYGAGADEPGRWRRLVTLAVPPPPALATAFFAYPQLKRSFYIFLFQTALAEAAVSADDYAFIAGLWADWSPGYDATEDLAHVRAALRSAENLAAAIGYYRALLDPSRHQAQFAREQAATAAVAPQPTLYLHGGADGCLDASLVAGAGGLLSAGSQVEVLDQVGHFLHLERPVEVNRRILDWVTA